MLSVPELGTKQDFLAEVEFSTIFPFDDFIEIQGLSWNFTSFLVNPAPFSNSQGLWGSWLTESFVTSGVKEDSRSTGF